MLKSVNLNAIKRKLERKTIVYHKTFPGVIQSICGALRDLVAFVQFKKREKQPRRSVNFLKVAGFSLQLY